MHSTAGCGLNGYHSDSDVLLPGEINKAQPHGIHKRELQFQQKLKFDSQPHELAVVYHIHCSLTKV